MPLVRFVEAKTSARVQLPLPQISTPTFKNTSLPVLRPVPQLCLFSNPSRPSWWLFYSSVAGLPQTPRTSTIARRSRVVNGLRSFPHSRHGASTYSWYGPPSHAGSGTSLDAFRHQEWDSASKIRNTAAETPMLLLSGVQDEVVPREHMQELWDLVQKRVPRGQRDVHAEQGDDGMKDTSIRKPDAGVAKFSRFVEFSAGTHSEWPAACRL